MTEILQPFSRIIDFASGHIDGVTSVTSRRLSDMRGWFASASAEAEPSSAIR